jgi:hypothetical protein
MRSAPGSLLAICKLSGTLVLASGLIGFVPPLIAKVVLPAVGGSAVVWDWMMGIFGTGTLLSGFAAWSLSGLSRSRQLIILLVIWLIASGLGALAGLQSPILIGDDGNPMSNAIAAAVGLATLIVFCLTTSALLLIRQANWQARIWCCESYFFLAPFYLGSLAGLIGYPMLIEPYLPVNAQIVAVEIGFVATGLLVFEELGRPLFMGRGDDTASWDAVERQSLPVKPWQGLCWACLAGPAGALILGVTTQVTVEVSPMPFFWLAPLALYETSRVIAFARIVPGRAIAFSAGIQLLALDVWLGPTALVWVQPEIASEGWFLSIAIMAGPALGLLFLPHRLTLPLQALLTGSVLLLLGLRQADIAVPGLPTLVEIGLLLATCAVAWWGCHGDLAAMRPDPDAFFPFILCSQAGVFVCALFMTAVAPIFWSSIVEFPLMLALAIVVRIPGRWVYAPAT